MVWFYIIPSYSLHLYQKSIMTLTICLSVGASFQATFMTKLTYDNNLR